MALVACPECGHPVSEVAPTCPECGFPLQQQKAREEDVAFARTGTSAGLYALAGLGVGAWDGGLSCALLGLLLGALAGWWFVRTIGTGFLPGSKPLYRFRARTVSGAAGEGVICAILGPIVLAVIYAIAESRDNNRPTPGIVGNPHFNATQLKSLTTAKTNTAVATSTYWQEAVVRRENALDKAETSLLKEPTTPAKYFDQLLSTFKQERDRVRGLPTAFVDQELIALVDAHLAADARLAVHYEALARHTKYPRSNKILNINLLTKENLEQFQAWLDNPPPELQPTLRGLNAEAEQLNKRPDELTAMKTKLEKKYGVRLALPDHASNPE